MEEMMVERVIEFLWWLTVVCLFLSNGIIFTVVFLFGRDKKKGEGRIKMYGLFSRVYDYHEWNELDCVSDSREKLKRRYDEMKAVDENIYPLIDQSEYDEWREMEHCHYSIVEVEVVQ